MKAAGLRELEFIGGEVDLRINIYRGKMALIMLIPMILGIVIPMALMGRYPDLTDEFAGDTEKLNASANEFITAMRLSKCIT